MKKPKIPHPPPSTELEEIVRAAQMGDPTAIEGLIESVQKDLYAFCFYLSKDTFHAEDLCQEALLKTIENLRALRDPAQFKSWMFRLTKNLFLDAIKLHDNRPKGGEEELQALSVESSAPELNLRIRQALFDLPPQDRLILILLDLHRYSYREAAEILEMSEEAVTSRLFRARQHFLKKFEGA
jgi:RNA polymerase sigma-70 factor, ECF subfamily